MQTRTISRRHRPRKRFGQHFLQPEWARKVAAAIAPQAGDVFLEIGPGTGALTLPLAASGRPILAVEIDRDLVADLAPRVPSNVTLMGGSFLDLDIVPFLTGLEGQSTPGSPGSGASRRYRIVGNLPYQITTPIMFRLIELYRSHVIPADATLMVQREVADRLAAKPGTRAYGALTIAAQRHADITKLLDLPPGAFRPAPKVHSTVIKLEFHPPSAPVADEALFDRLVRALFSQRRKTLSNALKAFDRSAPLALSVAKLDGRRRPETLHIQEIARLADLLAVRRAPTTN